MKELLIACLSATLLCGAIAETIPEPGAADARIRVVTYNPRNVVRLNTFFGVSTHIKFSETEQIKDVAVGDDLAWKVIPRGNNMFIKPTAKEGDTNKNLSICCRSFERKKSKGGMGESRSDLFSFFPLFRRRRCKCKCTRQSRSG